MIGISLAAAVPNSLSLYEGSETKGSWHETWRIYQKSELIVAYFETFEMSNLEYDKKSDV